MNDLIYNLRNPAMTYFGEGIGSLLDKEETMRDMAEAADEIESLRAELKKWKYEALRSSYHD